MGGFISAADLRVIAGSVSGACLQAVMALDLAVDAHQAGSAGVLAAALDMLRELLDIGSALDPGRLPATLERLGDSRDAEVIRRLYLDGLDLA